MRNGRTVHRDKVMRNGRPIRRDKVKSLLRREELFSFLLLEHDENCILVKRDTN